jgi:hypothetical protein
VIEHRNPSAYEFRASAQQAADLDLVHNSDKPTPIIDSIGNPTMLFGDVAEVNAAMVINHSVIVALICTVADEFDRLARSQVTVGITAAIYASRRFAPKPSYPAWIRCHGAFREQG